MGVLNVQRCNNMESLPIIIEVIEAHDSKIDVYLLPSTNIFNKQNDTVRMYIQYANINEWMALPLRISPDMCLYKLTSTEIAFDKNGDLVHYPFTSKVEPVKQWQLDKYIYQTSNKNKSINENQLLNYFVWEAFLKYIVSPQCKKRIEEKKKRKEENEFWCY